MCDAHLAPLVAVTVATIAIRALLLQKQFGTRSKDAKAGSGRLVSAYEKSTCHTDGLRSDPQVHGIHDARVIARSSLVYAGELLDTSSCSSM